MITPEYVQTMTAYNAEINRRIYAAAARLDDTERRAERGVFWGSLHGTLNHLLWADQMWMSRLAGWPRPPVGMKQSATMIDDFGRLAAVRETDDAGMSRWAEGIDPAWLGEKQTWFSGSVQREFHTPHTMLIVHVFNHQTHHRGQAHALLTRAGHDPGDTDIWLVLGKARARGATPSSDGRGEG